MTHRKTVVPSAACNATTPAECGEVGGDGFLLFNDYLVPYSFIEYVADHLEGTVVHRVVMSAREIVGEDFWQELDIREQQVIGDVLLMLVDTGRVALCCPEGH